MVLENPTHSGAHRVAGLVVSLPALREVPQPSNSRDKELSTSHDEGTNPQQSKQMIDPHIPGGGAPLDFSHWKPITFLNVSYTEHPDG